MTMQAFDGLRRLTCAAGASAGVFLRDVGHGLLEIGHNSLAAVGLAVVAVAIVVGGNHELLTRAELQALEWLQMRHGTRDEAASTQAVTAAEPDAGDSPAAVEPAVLTRQQSAVADWIARRYKVAPEPIAPLVREAWAVGQRTALDPTLILAIMAIESSFNPFAQSPVGAQGLMQVMTRVHNAKYEPFGGKHAAFDPLSNLQVGVQVLKECISRAGSLEAGLRYYVGAANQPDDGGYSVRVLWEQSLLKRVAQGKDVPVNTPRAPAAPAVASPKPAQGAEPAAPGTAAQEPASRDDRVAMVAADAPVH